MALCLGEGGMQGFFQCFADCTLFFVIFLLQMALSCFKKINSAINVMKFFFSHQQQVTEENTQKIHVKCSYGAGLG